MWVAMHHVIEKMDIIEETYLSISRIYQKEKKIWGKWDPLDDIPLTARLVLRFA